MFISFFKDRFVFENNKIKYTVNDSKLVYNRVNLTEEEKEHIYLGYSVKKECIFRISLINDKYVLSFAAFDNDKVLDEFKFTHINLEKKRLFTLDGRDRHFNDYNGLNKLLKEFYKIDLDKKYNSYIKDNIISKFTILKFS